MNKQQKEDFYQEIKQRLMDELSLGITDYEGKISPLEFGQKDWLFGKVKKWGVVLTNKI